MAVCRWLKAQAGQGLEFGNGKGLLLGGCKSPKQHQKEELLGLQGCSLPGKCKVLGLTTTTQNTKKSKTKKELLGLLQEDFILPRTTSSPALHASGHGLFVTLISVYSVHCSMLCLWGSQKPDCYSFKGCHLLRPNQPCAPSSPEAQKHECLHED